MAATAPQLHHIGRRAGVYMYRRRVPGDGQFEVALSLRTRNFRHAEYLTAALDRVFTERLLYGARMTPPAQPPALVAALRQYLREELAVHMASTQAPDGPYPLAMMPAQFMEETIELFQAHLARRDGHLVGHKVDALMAQHDLPATQRYAAEIGVLEVQIRLHQEALRRARGEVPLLLVPEDEAPTAQTPPPPAASPASTPPPPPPPASPAPSRPLASTLVEPFFERREKIDKATHQVMNQERGTLRRFFEVRGDKPADAYGRADVTAFNATLRLLPNTYGKSPKDKARILAEIIADPATASKPRLADKTVKRHLSALSQFFGHAVDEGHMTNAAWVELVKRGGSVSRYSVSAPITGSPAG